MTPAKIWEGIQSLLAQRQEADRLAAEVSDLKTKLSASDAEVATLKTALAEKDSTLSAKDSEVATAKADATKAQDEAKAAKATADAAEAKAADLLANPSKVAMEIVARAGVPAAARPSASVSAGVKTVTRAEFDAMSHTERNAFMRAGGKLTA